MTYQRQSDNIEVSSLFCENAALHVRSRNHLILEKAVPHPCLVKRAK